MYNSKRYTKPYFIVLQIQDRDNKILNKQKIVCNSVTQLKKAWK